MERLSCALGVLWPGTVPSPQAQDDHLVSFSPPRVGGDLMDVERRKDGCTIEHVGHDDVSDGTEFLKMSEN